MKTEMTDTKDPIFVGEETSYVITVTNQGGGEIANLVVKTTAPKELVVVRAKGPEMHQVSTNPDGFQQVLFAPVKSLAIGQKAVYEVFLKAAKDGDVLFRVEFTSDQLKKGVPVSETESTTIRIDTVSNEPPIALQGIVQPLKDD